MQKGREHPSRPAYLVVTWETGGLRYKATRPLAVCSPRRPEHRSDDLLYRGRFVFPVSRATIVFVQPRLILPRQR
jgi:hypothetical protein